MEPKKYRIKSFDKIFYCKVSNYGENYTISIGGKRGYCFVVSIKKHSDKAYIDRVEYNEACVKDGKLEENGGMYKLICGGLYFIKETFSNIKIITLKDDSHIYCKKGSKEYKMSLAFDYIIKYNKTWYQIKFNAKLPEDILLLFNNYLLYLDEPLPNYNYIVSLIPDINEFESIYLESKSPRDFIQNIREIYADKYCFKVCKWLHHFLNNIGIKSFSDLWYIDTENIVKPDIYSVNSTMNEMRGGGTKKRKNFSIVSARDVSIIGIYEH